jgi:uncharacterized UBP type Zn finger protein
LHIEDNQIYKEDIEEEKKQSATEIEEFRDLSLTENTLL